MWMLLSTAFAADLSDSQLLMGVGVESVTNDPFLYRSGVRQSIGWSPNAWAELGFSAAYYPILGQGGESDPDWKPLATQLLTENSISPDISKLLFQAQLTLRIHALRAPLSGGWTGSVGVLAGVGMVATQDSIIYLQSTPDGPTASEVHGSSAIGGFVQARQRWFGVRLRYESDVYIETIDSSTLEFKDNAMFGAEFLCWL